MVRGGANKTAGTKRGGRFNTWGACLNKLIQFMETHHFGRLPGRAARILPVWRGRRPSWLPLFYFRCVGDVEMGRGPVRGPFGSDFCGDG